MRPTPGYILHNCVAHPLLPFLPESWGDTLHDSTYRAIELEDALLKALSSKKKGKR